MFYAPPCFCCVLCCLLQQIRQHDGGHGFDDDRGAEGEAHIVLAADL